MKKILFASFCILMLFSSCDRKFYRFVGADVRVLEESYQTKDSLFLIQKDTLLLNKEHYISVYFNLKYYHRFVNYKKYNTIQTQVENFQHLSPVKFGYAGKCGSREKVAANTFFVTDSDTIYFNVATKVETKKMLFVKKKTLVGFFPAHEVPLSIVAFIKGVNSNDVWVNCADRISYVTGDLIFKTEPKFKQGYQKIVFELKLSDGKVIRSERVVFIKESEYY